MTVAQVIGGSYQIERAAMLRAGRDMQNGLVGSLYLDERAIFGHQHVTATHHRAARQKNAQRATLAVRRVKSAFFDVCPSPA